MLKLIHLPRPPGFEESLQDPEEATKVLYNTTGIY